MRVIIPPNFDDNGGVLMGLLEKRNAAEAGIFLGIMITLLIILAKVISSAIFFAFYIIFAIAGTAIFAIGIGDDSVLQFIIILIKYRSNKGISTLMPPSDPNHG